MILKYDIEINNEAILANINRIINQIFKLLPVREENGEWKSSLQNLILEVKGMNILFNDQIDLFELLCKMNVLDTLDKEEDFFSFRKTIFECLTLLDKIKNNLCQN